MISDEYLAGLVDGEGCIVLFNGNGKAYTITLSIGMSSPQIFDELKKLNPAPKVNGYERPRARYIAYVGRWIGSTAGDILERIIPFLILKRPQAVAALQYEQFRRWFRKKYGYRCIPELNQYGAAVKTQLTRMKQESYQ